MGNQTTQKQSSDSLPFYTRSSDYNPLGEEQEQSFKCSLKNRVMGFVICCSLGWIISIIATISLIIKHNTVQFAILYSIGQIINITGSCLLATPKTQIKKMTNKSRVVLSVFYIGSIILTLVLALTLPENLLFLVFISLIVQIVAYFFYTLSFIPGGRKFLNKICRFMVA